MPDKSPAASPRLVVIPDVHHRIARASEVLRAEASLPGTSFCFLGDYQDDFFDTPHHAHATAVWMREQIEAGHRLLWGNHDLPYAFLPDRHPCPGYEPEKARAIARVLTREHWMKLRLWHIVEAEPRPWVLSHAGIHPAWLGPGITASGNGAAALARLRALEEEALDCLYHRGSTHPVIHSCPPSRGGRDPAGGVLWMDWGDMQPVAGLNQLVGHTPLRNPDQYSNDASTNWCIDTHLNHYGVLENGELTIHRASAAAG